MGRKGGHGNEGANLWYRPMAALILLVSIMYSVHSANLSNQSMRRKIIAKRRRVCCERLFLCCSMGHFCTESELPCLYAVDRQAHVTLQAVRNVFMQTTFESQVVSLCSRCCFAAGSSRAVRFDGGLIGWWAAGGFFLEPRWIESFYGWLRLAGGLALFF